MLSTTTMTEPLAPTAGPTWFTPPLGETFSLLRGGGEDPDDLDLSLVVRAGAPAAMPCGAHPAAPCELLHGRRLRAWSTAAAVQCSGLPELCLLDADGTDPRTVDGR